jgi:hypothetical protein
MIGEHGLIDHGFYPWEANARVMVVATGVEQGGLPEPLAGELVHDLVLDGRIAHGPTNPTEAAFGHPHRAGNTGGRFFTERTAAFWQGTDKWVWLGSTLARFDLAADPSEARPLPADPEPPAFTALRARVENFVASKRGDDALREQLEAAGYLEPEAENDPDESTSDAVDEPTTTPGGEMGGRPP